jgi:hypothetical protein
MVQPSRRQLLAGLLGAAACRHDPSVEERGRDWLLAQQSPDGGFRSEITGVLRPGASLTGLCVLALAGAPGVPVEALSRGLGFLVASRGPTGALGLGEVPDYPVYATAMASSALARIRPPGWREAAEPMVGWLLSQQLRGEGWGADPSRGGFPMGGASARVPPHAGHVDLSMTRRAVQAMRAWGLAADHPAWAEARRFVLACGTGDGGFRYSPGDAGVNKGATAEAAYGTATADGVVALRAIGGAEEGVDRGLRWLAAAFRADENPGVGGAFARYGPAMRFYWRAAVAEAFAGGGGPPGFAVALRDALAAEQRADGAWRNAAGEQKEDDPLVATALALVALRGGAG